MASPRAAHRRLVDAVCLSATVLIRYRLSLHAVPGVGGGGDAAKFQFLGRVLGTAHPPGYPLYVMVSHVFGWLPIGSLAYRINVMSALSAALTAGVMYLASRGLGAGWLAAAASSFAWRSGACSGRRPLGQRCTRWEDCWSAPRCSRRWPGNGGGRRRTCSWRWPRPRRPSAIT